MRSLATLALAASSFICADALTLVQRRDGAPRVIEHTIQRRAYDGTNPMERDRRRMRKRATVSEVLDNEETLYFMNASLGTPAQDLRLHIDTGSSDLWVNTPSSQQCEESSNPCAVSGTYSANDSSTYEYVNSLFNISYVDGSGSSGDYASDVLRMGDNVQLDNQQFGIGYSSSSMEGVLGIGYAINEVAASATGRTYPNVPQNLMINNYISSNAYSLWLNDLDASTGSILFGGVNTGKYTGELKTVPIVQEQGFYAEFIIALTAVGANGDSGAIVNDTAIGALLDSGSSLMYLPDDIANAIYEAVNAEYDSNQGAAFVDCDLANQQGTLDFSFSGAEIQVDLSELVIVAGYQGRQPICILGVGMAGDSTPVLGDTFLRSAYVVYDLTNNEISLAQTNFNSTDSNVLEITNSTGVPSATAVQNAVTSVAVAGDGAINVGQPSVTSDGAAPAQTAMTGMNFALLGAAGAALLAL